MEDIENKSISPYVNIYDSITQDFNTEACETQLDSADVKSETNIVFDRDELQNNESASSSFATESQCYIPATQDQHSIYNELNSSNTGKNLYKNESFSNEAQFKTPEQHGNSNTKENFDVPHAQTSIKRATRANKVAKGFYSEQKGTAQLTVSKTFIYNTP